MKKFFREFKAFISKGNVIDLAVAVIIGAAFNAIISNLVQNIIMPLISFATGGVNVADWKWVITPGDAALGIKETALFYGLFIQAILDFLIIAFCVFIALRLLNRFRMGIKNIEDSRLNRKDKKEMIKSGLNPRNKEDVEVYKERLAEIEKEKEEKRMAALAEERRKNPTEKDLLKEIRDLLKGVNNP